MIGLGLRLTVALAAILAFLALAPGRGASATIDMTGSWAVVYSTATNLNFGDCTAGFVQSGPPDHYMHAPPGVTCESSGAPPRTGGQLGADLTGMTFHGTAVFPSPLLVVHFSGTVSADGNTITNGTWDDLPFADTGSWTASRQQSTPAGSNQTVMENGATLKFVGANPGGDTAIVIAPTADGALPASFQLVGQYYHVITTVPHGPPGPYIFCAGYVDDGAGHEATTGVLESALQIAHFNETTLLWEFEPRYEITGGLLPPPYSSMGLNRVCARVDHLSQFALVGPASVGGLVDILGSDSSSGVGTWLWTASMAGVAIGLSAAGGWLAMGRRRLR